MTLTKEFLVFRKSENTNSFGLYQVFLMAKDGEAYKSCASSFNVKPVGTIIIGSFYVDDKTKKRQNNCMFIGHELTERLSINAPDDVVKDVWQLKKEMI